MRLIFFLQLIFPNDQAFAIGKYIIFLRKFADYIGFYSPYFTISLLVHKAPLLKTTIQLLTVFSFSWKTAHKKHIFIFPR